MAQSSEKLPEWMLLLENKRKKPHRLAHEIGAGAPCFMCGEKCPGLDLHFWRKLCRNCKCKKEDHDVKDDEGYEQFEILLGSDKRKTKRGGFLKIKVPEDVKSPVKPQTNVNKGVAFDWLPPNVSDDVAAEYMKQLPVGKLPISGSDGALYRRQQLEKQVPLHDLNADHCHNLTFEETEQLTKYLENLKNNVVGLGCVAKIPALYSEARVPLTGPFQQRAHSQSLGRTLASSVSADPIRPLPPMPPAYNSAPRPFHASSSSSAYGSGEEDDTPPALPSSLPPRSDLRTPSEFIDWRLPEDHSSLGKISEGMQEMNLQQMGFPSSFNNDQYNHPISSSTFHPKEQMKFCGNILPSQLSISGNYQCQPQKSFTSTSHDVNVGDALCSLLLGEDSKEMGVAISRGPQSGKSVLQSHPQGKAMKGILHQEDYDDLKLKALSGAVNPSGVAVLKSSMVEFEDKAAHPANSTQIVSFPTDIVSSSPFTQPGGYDVSKSLSSNMVSQHKATDSYGNTQTSSVGVLPVDGTQTWILSGDSRGMAHSENVACVPGVAVPLEGKTKTNVISTGSGQSSDVGLGVKSGDSATCGPFSKGSNTVDPSNANLLRSSISSETPYSEEIVGVKRFAQALGERKRGASSTVPGITVGTGSATQDSQHVGGLQALSIGVQIRDPEANPVEQNSVLPVDGVLTANIAPHSIVQSNSVGTDALPKSAQIMQQQQSSMLHPANVLPSAGSSGLMPAETPGGSVSFLDCRECGLKLLAGDVAVFAERAGNAAWHPSCFVCTTCKELLVDLMYFYHKSNVYCGRHFAELLGIPRCFACDELIFVKEYTMAEGKCFHVKHFCCYECDIPLAGKQYIPMEGQPVCLECYERIYGKKCHTCQKKIAPGEQRVGWKDLNWHVQGNCFRCFECTKSLLGNRFVVKENQPFCSKECVQAGLQKMVG